MREEGAVGGSVAGSTAGWWPSDRDRFPPRFLLPPSLQTHNCIISTHLASSPLAPPPGPVAPPQPFSLSLFLGSFLLLVRQPSASPPSWSDLVRACSSLISRSFVRSSDRPTGRFSVPLFVSLPPVVIIIHHVSSALSHESVATRAKRPTASSFLRRSSRSRIVLPLALSSARSVSSPLSSLSVFLTSRSRGHAAYSLLHSSSSSPPPLSPRLPRLFFSVIVIVVVLLLVLLFFFFVYLVVRSVIGPAIPPGGHNYLSHATTWAVHGWEGRGPKMNGRAGGRTPSRTKRS